MSDLLTSEDLKTERATEPRWRNWWRLYPPTYVRCNACGTFHHSPDGAVFDYGGCCSTYESRFEAELNAKEDYDPSCDQAKVEWLGAYVDGERPA